MLNIIKTSACTEVISTIVMAVILMKISIPNKTDRRKIERERGISRSVHGEAAHATDYFLQALLLYEYRKKNFYQLFICSGTMRSTLSDETGLFFQSGSYFTNHESQKLLDKRMNMGCNTINNTAFIIPQYNKR